MSNFYVTKVYYLIFLYFRDYFNCFKVLTLDQNFMKWSHLHEICFVLPFTAFLHLSNQYQFRYFVLGDYHQILNSQLSHFGIVSLTIIRRNSTICHDDFLAKYLQNLYSLFNYIIVKSISFY